jgi:hypothetical protein
MTQDEAIALIWELSGNTLTERHVRDLVQSQGYELGWMIRGLATHNDALKRRKVWCEIQKTIGQVDGWGSAAEAISLAVAGIPTLL